MFLGFGALCGFRHPMKVLERIPRGTVLAGVKANFGGQREKGRVCTQDPCMLESPRALDNTAAWATPH